MKKIIFWIFTLVIIICSVIGLVISDKKNKKELKNIIIDKKISEKQLRCLNEGEEQNIEKIYYFDENDMVKTEYDTNIYSSVSKTSEEYKTQVEEHFKNLFCDGNECQFKWDGKKITVSYKSKISEDFDKSDKKTLKKKMKDIDSNYKCK